MDGWSRERQTKPADRQTPNNKAQNRVHTNSLRKTHTHTRSREKVTRGLIAVL